MQLTKVSGALALGLLISGTQGCHDPLPDLVQDPPSGTTSAPPVVFVPSPRDAGSSPSASATFHPTPSAEPLPTPVDPDANEPRRDPALTLVHGLVDSRYIYLCRTDPSGQIAADAELEPPGGLLFGQHWVWTEDDLDFETELGWWLLGSERALAAGTSCMTAIERGAPSSGDAGTKRTDADAASPVRGRDAGLVDAQGLDASADTPPDTARDAGSLGPDSDAGSATLDGASGEPTADASVEVVVVPSLRFRPFITLPQGSLADGRSTLLVASGCLGGFDVPDSTWCGTSEPRGSDALRPVFVPLSRRTAFSALGLQALNASTFARASVRSQPDEGASGAVLSLATDLVPGQLWPRQVNTSITLEDLGEDPGSVELQLVLGLGDEPVLRQTWQQALDFGGVPSLVHGRAYSLLLLGAVLPRTVTGLNGARFVVIDNDPLTR